MPTLSQTHAIGNLDQLADFAQRLAARLRVADCLLLDGDLGAGKTTLVKALCDALGCRDVVTSPTYTIAQLYRCPLGPILHLDAYRLKSSDELWDLGYEDEMDTGITLIEWGQKVAQDFPDALRIGFAIQEGSSRLVSLQSNAETWAERLQGLEAAA